MAGGLLTAHWALCHREGLVHAPLSPALEAAAAAALALLTEPAVAGNVQGAAQPVGLEYTELQAQTEQLRSLAHALLRHYAVAGWDALVRVPGLEDTASQSKHAV